MKKIILLSLITVALFSCQSNDDFLEENPRSIATTTGFIKDNETMELMLNGLYNRWERALDRPYESMEIKLPSADDICGTGNQRPMYNMTEINAAHNAYIDNDVSEGWDRCWYAINQANTIINDHDKAVGNMSESAINEAVAQARFIRGFTYFWLVRWFGRIPLYNDAFTPDYSVGLASPKEVYDFIIEDLKFAKEYLPVKYSDANKVAGGAVTKGAASSLLAKVYLQMAGYPVNGGTEYYALARDEAKDVIDHASEYGYCLRDHYWEPWDPNWRGGQQSPDETILFLNHSGSQYSVRSPLASRPLQLSGWESMVAELGFYRRFPAGERKEFTFVDVLNITVGGQTMSLPYTYLDCKHPLYRKYWAEDGDGDNWKWEDRATNYWSYNMQYARDWRSTRPDIIMRYPDILLTYAEAKARTDGPDALAYQCLNAVRNRAYKGVGTTEASVSNLSTEEFIDTVVWERAWEFAGFEYSSRWFDLQRLELVERANTEWREETEEKYQLVKPYEKSDYFLQIPDRELRLNPNLKDNNIIP